MVVSGLCVSSVTPCDCGSRSHPGYCGELPSPWPWRLASWLLGPWSRRASVLRVRGLAHSRRATTRSKRENLGRITEIAQAAARHGFGYFIERHRLGDLIPGASTSTLEPPGRRGVHLRELLEELGPTFVKFGQLLSMRPDVLPPDVIAELRLLQADVRPVPLRARWSRSSRRSSASPRSACSSSSTRSRSPPPRSDRCTGRCSRTGSGSSSRCSAPARRGRSRRTSRSSTSWRGSCASACARSTSSTRARSSTSSRTASAPSSTTASRGATATPCGAASPASSGSPSRRSTGATRRGGCSRSSTSTASRSPRSASSASPTTSAPSSRGSSRRRGWR